MFYIEIEHFDQWRDYARLLLQRNITPSNISWNANESSASLFEKNSEDINGIDTVNVAPRIPQKFITLAENAACFRDPQRWALLYQIAWRLVFENKRLLNDAIDPDITRLYAMNKAINRDKHKMTAFVRFQQVKCINTDDEYFVAWFEPEHLILPTKISFFIKRFTNMCWSILTPDACAHWDGHTLQLTSGVKRPENLHDDLETLWLEYYKNIFNPARLKLKAMQSEMPKKYWRNLPETTLIKTLTQNAQSQTERMIGTSNFDMCQKNNRSIFIQEKQAKLRNTRLLKATKDHNNDDQFT